MFTSPFESLALSGGNISDQNTSTIVIQLSQADLDALKLETYVCSMRGNCYVSITSQFADDMNGNPTAAVEQVFPGFLVVDFIRDQIQPELSAFDLNLEEGILVLEFSEPH